MSLLEYFDIQEMTDDKYSKEFDCEKWVQISE